MGYTTDFDGYFEVSPPMSDSLVEEINEFADTRHGGNLNVYPGYPGFWCQWVAADPTTIEWDGGEKFYNYVEWLHHIIDKFIKPNGHTLNGEVRWRGEEFSDIGTIEVKDNVVSVFSSW